jgi:hypothetical protein
VQQTGKVVLLSFNNRLTAKKGWLLYKKVMKISTGNDPVRPQILSRGIGLKNLAQFSCQF